MITIDVPRLCKIKGIDRPHAFLTSNGFSDRVATSLTTGRRKSVRLDHLERLCRLFYGLPNDIFDYKPTGRGLNPAHDVLLPLRKKPLEPQNLNSLIASLPPDEVLSLSAEIHARYNKPPAEPTTDQ